jgi:hypothetical protein
MITPAPPPPGGRPKPVGGAAAPYVFGDDVLLRALPMDTQIQVYQLRVLHQIRDTGAAILAAINQLGEQMGAGFNTLDEGLAGVVAAVDTEDADVTRVLADFAAKVAGQLTTEQQAEFQSIIDKVSASTTAIDTADPVAPAAPAAAPVATTPVGGPLE